MSVKAILAGQGSGGTETFEAIYGVTTSAEIEAAYQEGQDVVCKYNDFIFQLSRRNSSTEHIFTTILGETTRGLQCSNDTWTNYSTTFTPVNSPTLTGTPTAPTATAGTNTTQVATTAFIQTTNSGITEEVDEYAQAAAHGKMGVISLDTSSFEWGDETGNADASWFEALSKTPPSEDWVGKTKSVTLSGAVLGTTTHLIRCIGVNQDGEGTVTFQTANCLANTTVFGDFPWWSDCTARTECQNYYNAFPGKDYIKQLIKVSNLRFDKSSTDMGTTDDYVWLPSFDEVGLGSYTYAPGGDEYTQGCSTPYSYYSSNDSRTKKNGDSGSACFWWTRSHSTSNRGAIGIVASGGGGNYVDDWSNSYYLAPAFAIQCPASGFYQGDENVTSDVIDLIIDNPLSNDATLRRIFLSSSKPSSELGNNSDLWFVYL